MNNAPIDPRHYAEMTLEPIDVIEAWRLNYNLGNVIKYVARAPYKGTHCEDLIKAANYAFRDATGLWLPRDLIAQHLRDMGVGQ